MPKKFAFFFLGLILVGFFIGITRLFILRFERGDVYPPYSSLRSDPLGVKILFDSLREFQDKSLQRNVRPISKLEGDPYTVFLHLGSKPIAFTAATQDFFGAFDKIAADGGHVIISFSPIQNRSSAYGIEKGSTCDEKTPNPGEDEEILNEEPPDPFDTNDHYVSIRDHWGVDFGVEETQQDAIENIVATRSLGTDNEDQPTYRDLPDSFLWHSLLYFEEPDASWRVLYTRNDYPVIIERQIGQGKIILSADSFFFSNESLWKERNTSLLYALLGNRGHIIFDESHFGVVSSQGIIDLLKKYRLAYFLISLFLIAGLFVWKNSSPLIFAKHTGNVVSEGSDIIHSKKDYFEGLTSLLQRHIATNRILRVCFDEWEKQHSANHFQNINFQQEKKDKIKKIFMACQDKQIEPVEGYESIHRILLEGKTYETRN